jgi:hypothetical protein
MGNWERQEERKRSKERRRKKEREMVSKLPSSTAEIR